MYIVVGLGNPGNKYSGTRHNVGFHTIDLLAERNGIKVGKLKFKSLYGEGFIAGEKVLLVKPQTYMNLSGQSVIDLVNFYKMDMKNLIVIYDDIDVKLGSLRIREKGSAGTHNGMKSIIYLLQRDDFPRIRIGVGRPETEDLGDYVLSPFIGEEIPVIKDVIQRAAMAAETIIQKELQEAMNKYNG
ncbi:aminoacyl-tRNA hydrolase [Alkaliphilus serpentinus]|uniref:Peptidyl-tRNA hydrolase n=1 Tax=Alkaliphilus serpentinus TaxID=1482731 RepID=A0A833HQJ5_9FIRM|nr:aminoacyl-tRNA hydrolase [Alkaliphilus serpentinus]KAB3531846.1 aminoacyl-tRNA hydrolase [Alkaliphilus serpentinus]